MQPRGNHFEFPLTDSYDLCYVPLELLQANVMILFWETL